MAKPSADTSALPSPSNERTYLRIRPTETQLDPATVEHHFRRLHQLETPRSNRGLRTLFRSRSEPPASVEWLLVSDGDPETPIEYYVGTTTEKRLDGLERLCRGLFPNEYELERVQWHPNRLVDPLAIESVVTSPDSGSMFDTDGDDESADEPDEEETEQSPTDGSPEATEREETAGDPLLEDTNADSTTEADSTIDDSDDLETRVRRPQLDEVEIAAIDFHGTTERRNDWQTQLTSFSAFEREESTRLPLSAIIETMAETPLPMVYQALCQPYPDYHAQVETRQLRLEAGRDTPAQRLVDDWFGSTNDPAETLDDPAAEIRLSELSTKDARRSFVVNARLAALTNEHLDARSLHALAGMAPENALSDLSSTFASAGQTCYQIDGQVKTGEEARTLFTALRSRDVHPPTYDRLYTKLPWTANTSRAIIADPAEIPVFCVLDGAALTASGSRLLSPTPSERTALPRPPREQLQTYHGSGLTLGTPLTQDGTPDSDSISLPVDLQSLHVAWFGKTGSGKSTSLINAILENHAATEGADILIDPKGDGMALDYLRAHYATYGTLDNVVYFDCASILPAFSFFDIRDQLDAGVSRTTAVEDLVDHYLEILTQIMGADRFGQAVRSPDIIRYLVKAMFDPVNGADAFSHRELHEAVRRMHERQSAPAVSDDDLERMLGGVVANRAQSFDEIMQGVANRMEKIPVDRRLARIFNHVPTEPTSADERDGETDGSDEPTSDENGQTTTDSDPYFDIAHYLDEDAVIIFDTGRLRSDAQRVLTLVVLSNLWTALKRRSRRSDRESDPLVNLYIEEAASVAVSDLLNDLLSQSRGFDCSITLAMQFPAQLKEADARAYDEVLNNVSTFVTGNVPIDRRLATRLATDEMDPSAVGNRLRALRRGQWLVSLPAPFDTPEPRPFLLRSCTPPPGDPAGDQPLSATERDAIDSEIEGVRERTLERAGLTLSSPSATDSDDIETLDPAAVRVDSALPYTNRLPPTVEYDSDLHGLRCTECDNRYDPSIEGMRRTIECCSFLDEVDRNDIPICDLNLKLTPDERRESSWSDRQLMFVQAVYNAQQLRYDPLEYDLRFDSMIRLQEYVGIETDAVEDLIEMDLLRHDTDHPHRLFTVSPLGRSVIGESYRRGIDYGHGKGDLEESSQHVFAVEVGRQYLEAEYVDDPESAVVEVIPYYDMQEGSLPVSAFMAGDDEAADVSNEYEQRRLDIAGLDAEGEVVVAMEIERINNDVKRAVPEDFDKMAACGVEEAIWIVMTRQGGHDVLDALNTPPDGTPRVEKTYSENTPPQQFRIDTPGLTAIYPVEYIRDFIDP